jgi:PAS domain S-box-containing protein
MNNKKKKSDQKKTGKSPQKRYTIGLLTDILAGSYAAEMARAAEELTRAEDINLLSFSGGILDDPNGFWSEANAIYDLVDPENVDALVVASGMLGAYIDTEKLKEFFHRFSVPVISLGIGLEGIPSVLSDNYAGMHEAVVHLVKEHGHRRIIFLKGPEGHPEAEERYQAYVEALTGNGISIIPELVLAGDFREITGRDMISTFLDAKGLDFDAIVSANDEMAFGALEVLQERGIRVPYDVAVVGFDNTHRCDFVMPPLTTVQQPIEAMTAQAVKMLQAQLAGNEVPGQIVLPTELVLRQSCGCQTSTVVEAALGVEPVEKMQVVNHEEALEIVVFQRREEILSLMRQVVDNNVKGLQPDWAERLLDAFWAALTSESSDQALDDFLPVLNETLRDVVVGGNDVRAWQGVISTLRREILPYLQGKELTHAEDIWQQARVVVGEISHWVPSFQAQQADHRAELLRDISANLINAFDRDELLDALAYHLPRLNMKSCYLSLYEDPQKPVERSKLMFAFNEQERITLAAGERSFPTRQLVPEDVLSRAERYSFVVSPLYFKKEQFGFVVFAKGLPEETMYEVLRGEISSALQGALLVKKYDEAEQALSERVTELEEAEVTLVGESRRDRLFLENVLDALDDPVFVKDEDHRWVILNDAWCNFLGLTKEDALGKSDVDFFPAEEAEVFWKHDDLAFATEQVDINEEQYTDLSGEVHTISTKKSVFTDPVSKKKFLAGSIRDITELKRAQEDILTKFTNELELVAQVSIATSTFLETAELLQNVVDLTKEKFELYHAHIYLLNNAGDTLALAAGAGDVGRKMVAEGWQIPLDREQSLVARAARLREGVMIDDTQQEPDWLPNPLLPDTRSELAVPLIVGARVLGVLDVQSDKLAYFTQDDVRRKTTLAAQIAIALENARLFEQTQHSLTETTRLYETSRRVSEANDLNELLVAIAEADDSSEINRILLTSFEHNAAGTVEALSVTANWFNGHGTPPPEVGRRFSLDAIPYKNLLFSLEPTFIDDVLHEERLDFDAIAAIQEARVQAMAILPLWVGDRQLGVLLLRSEEIHTFTQAEQRLYTSLAQQVAVAVENQQLLAETQSVLNELEATQRRYTIQAWDTYRKRNSALNYEQVRPEQSLAAEDRAEDQSILSEDVPLLTDGSDDTNPANGSVQDERSLQPLPAKPEISMEVPLKIRGEEIGVLGIAETDQQRVWSSEEIALVEALAEQIAQAADNLRLIDETQQAAARETRVNEIGDKIQSAQSLEEALRIAVKEVGLSLKVPQTAVQLKVND